MIRFLGGISFLFILSKTYLNYPHFLLYVAMFFSILLTFYPLILSYYRFKHMIRVLKSDALDVKIHP